MAGFKTLCLSGVYQKQDEDKKAILDTLLRRITDTLDGAGIRANDDCEPADAVNGQTQLNLYYTFTTTTSGAVYKVALEAWLDTDSSYNDVTPFFNSIEAGAGAILLAADTLDVLMDGFIEDRDSAH